MSTDISQITALVIVPTLKYLSPEIPFSNSAVKLLQMTLAHESNCGQYIAQLGGPALGIYQMEPATQYDIDSNYLEYREELQFRVDQTGHCVSKISPLLNPVYATAMARVHYYRDKEALPSANDLIGLANYAKRVWNTEEGKATARDYYAAFEKYVK